MTAIDGYSPIPANVTSDPSLAPRAPLFRPRRIPKSKQRGCTRTISNETDLRFLYITQDMHKQLALQAMFPSHDPGRRRAQTCHVHLCVPATGASLSVKMVRTVSNGKQHRRFREGWRSFCEQAGLQVGDVLRFKRGVDVNSLTVHIEKRR